MAIGSFLRVWLGGVLLLTMVSILGCEPVDAPGPPASTTEPAEPAAAQASDGSEAPSDATADPAAEPADPAADVESDPFAAEPESPFPADDVAAPPDPASSDEPDQPAEPEEPAVDLGPPLVDNLEADYQQLDPRRPIWINKQQTEVVIVGQVVQNDVLLELFACLKDTKEHEAIIAVDLEAFFVHTGLLAVGGQSGRPANFDPVYQPASGSKIKVLVRWKDAEGRQHTDRAQDWILDAETGEPLQHDWVFAGSGFWKDEETGKQHYLAEQGDLICVSNFPTATLDLPIQSSDANSALMYRANPERVPPVGTPITLILSPIEEQK